MEIKNDDERVVHNRNGHLLINPEGLVASCYIDDGVEDFTGHFRYITRVDLNEWRSHWRTEPLNELDASDVAYWYKLPDQVEEIYQAADSNVRAERALWKLQVLQSTFPDR
jgi:hypothetical protein